MAVVARARFGRVITLATTLVLAAILTGCSGSEAPAAAAALVGKPAPSLSGQSLTGAGTVDLASMTGKPTAVVFWLNTCPHCQAFVPAIQSAWSGIADKANILLVGMPHPDPSATTTAGFETPAAFVASTGLTLPTIEGDWTTAAAEWGFEEVPAIYVLDADHVVKKVLTGGDAGEVVSALSALGG